jgi:hypothetical protein
MVWLNSYNSVVEYNQEYNTSKTRNDEYILIGVLYIK